jgi:hypothetical protein
MAKVREKKKGFTSRISIIYSYTEVLEGAGIIGSGE